LPNLSDADAMILQATYARGPSAFPAIDGQPTLGVNDFGHAGVVDPRLGPPLGTPAYNYDCAIADQPSGRCDKSTGYALIAAFKHFWTPTVSSSLFASFVGMNYSDPARLNGGGSNDAEAGASSSAVTKPSSTKPPLTWTPLKNLLVGGEAPWAQGVGATPAGKPAPPSNATTSPSNPAAPWPATGEWSGRIRVQRSF